MNKILATETLYLYHGDLLLVFAANGNKRSFDIHKQDFYLGNSMRRFAWNSDEKCEELMEFLKVLKNEPSESDILFVELDNLDWICSFGHFEARVQSLELRKFKEELSSFITEECLFYGNN